ncbi:MAG: PucR family transcriptional regulator ligand-binding domain-containing protein [Clostridium sp.]|nr:PucR family transcriptional regulator [Clostridium sp.]MCH3963971.1 PucR family transcriptional regulator ligand-binding domain-containing protein [Clostridium sp.]MCI1716172.1 PucR family transcriptional regulator ligand-binding domain-containing protein [Clostridium sp.]MCI1800588.1 PucR family transcriptional regulator ligand-binding domain-containing protein [Clostridium sp.]MCI1814349.1 PucR family transcriptional regulator ligand-binding domain-containing protein [Clostridium sp.]MCI1
MFVTCRSILNLPGLEEMKIVAGSGGLDRIISWVHVIEIPDAVNYVKGGELLFITGIAIGDNVEKLLKFVNDINMRKLSGLVINVGPYIKSTPEKVIELANKIDFPIFELPFQVRLIDVTQNICRTIFTKNAQKQFMNNFMKEIIFENIDITDEILNRAILYGYNVDAYYCALVVDIDDFNLFLKSNELYDENTIVEIKSRIQAIIEGVIHKNNRKYFCVVQSDAFFIMVSLDKDEKSADDNTVESKMIHIAESIKAEINEKSKPITVSIGIGGMCKELGKFKTVILEARKSLEIAKKFSRNNCIVNYKDLGVFRLFFEMNSYKEMRRLFDENLMKLKEYDEKNSSNLVKTLDAYLKNNRNLGNTAEELYLHRNTMKYRIKRIEEILDCDLKNEETVFNIKLSMRIGIFLRLLRIRN